MLPVTKVAEKPHKFGLWQVLPFYIHMRHIFLMIPRWVVKFSRETSGLKYRDEKGKRHCLCPHTINISILWVWLTSCKPPTLFPCRQRHWAGAVKQRASRWLNPIRYGQRLDRGHSTLFTCILHQVQNNIGIHWLMFMPVNSQDCQVLLIYIL